jgi:tetratricopeptide (TPR) repeat protein
MEREQPDESATPPWFLRRGSLEILACGLTALVYLRTLGYDFVYDDIPQILKNPAIQDWRYLPQYFTSHVLAAIYTNSAGNYYRPLFLLWLRLNYVWFGAHPAGWHATSVLCHVAATWLVFGLAQQLTRDRMIACSAALLFGLHPAHIENVAWISGASDLLMTCFVLASCSAFLSSCESKKASMRVLSLGLFVLAMLSKEPAIVLPLLIFALSWIRPPGSALDDQQTDDHQADDHQADNQQADNLPARNFRFGLLAAVRAAAPYGLVALIYLGVRYRALNGFAHPTISISWTEIFLTWPSVVWFYVKHLLFPFHLSEFYSLDYVRHATAGQVALPLLFLFATGLALHYWIGNLPQKDVAVFALALIALPLLPVLDLRSLTAGDIVHDRYLYLSSAGFALLAALSIAAVGRHIAEMRIPKRPSLIVAAALTGVVSLLFAGLTLMQQAQWANDIQLFARGVASAPDNLTVRDNLANALLDANQPDRAIPLYLDILKRAPNFWRSNYNLGFAYYKTGNPAAAEQSLQRAVRIDPSDSDQYIYLAIVELQLKKLPEAAGNARKAIVRNPQARGYYFILGLIYQSAGDRKAAAEAFKAELTQHPDNASAAAELEKIESPGERPRP